MNKHDRENLNFLLSIDAATFKDWYDKMDADDHDYAMELLCAYSKELDARALVLRMEAEDEVTDVSCAREVLARFAR